LPHWQRGEYLTREDGPGRIFASLREKLEHRSFGQILNCIKCAGVWVSIPFAFFVQGSWIELIVTWLALSGVTAVIDEWTRPPFEWEETKDDGVLRKNSNRTFE
jgi:hypothetical protein